MSKLSKKLKIPKTTLLYHLNYLEKKDIISVKSVDRFNRYYGKQKVGMIDKKILAVLRQEIPCKIIIYMILHKDYASQIEISQFLKKHKSTVSYHLNKLMEADLIESMPFKNGIRYRINNEHEIYEFFIRYEKSLFNDFLPFALDWWDYLIGSNRMDKIIESIFDVFPNPYYS